MDDTKSQFLKPHVCSRYDSKPSGALDPAGIILKSNPVAAAGPEGLWPGGNSGATFLTG